MYVINCSSTCNLKYLQMKINSQSINLSTSFVKIQASSYFSYKTVYTLTCVSITNKLNNYDNMYMKYQTFDYQTAIESKSMMVLLMAWQN